MPECAIDGCDSPGVQQTDQGIVCHRHASNTDSTSAPCGTDGCTTYKGLVSTHVQGCPSHSTTYEADPAPFACGCWEHGMCLDHVKKAVEAERARIRQDVMSLGCSPDEQLFRRQVLAMIDGGPTDA